MGTKPSTFEQKQQPKKKYNFSNSQWNSISLQTRKEIAKHLTNALHDAAQETNYILLICEPAPDIIIQLSESIAMQAKGFLPDTSTYINVIATREELNSNSENHHNNIIQISRGKSGYYYYYSGNEEYVIAEAAIIAVLQQYKMNLLNNFSFSSLSLLYSLKNGPFVMPGIFALPSHATIGELKSSIRHRYALSKRTRMEVFFEEGNSSEINVNHNNNNNNNNNNETKPLLVLPLDCVTLAEACTQVRNDGFVYCPVVIEGEF